MGLWLALFISLQSFALTVDDLVIQPAQNLKPPVELSASQVQEDLEVLSLAVRDGYEGPDFLSRLSKITAHKTTPENLCNEIAAILAKVTNAHLRAYLEFKSCGRGFPTGRAGGNLAQGLDRWLVKDVDGVKVVAIPNFWPMFDHRWSGLLDKVREIRQANEPFIIDLRGNPGGDDSMGFELARILLGADLNATLPTPVESREFRQTPAAFALQANAWMWNELKLRRDNLAVPAGIAQRRSEILDWMERAKKQEFPELYKEQLTPAPLDKSKIFAQAIYVLIDAGCASACETTIQVLESLPQRILVGQNTLGAVEYGEMGRVLMPNSKVSVTLTTMSVEFKDKRHPEKIGYAPDILVKAGGDALAEAIESIQSQKIK